MKNKKKYIGVSILLIFAFYFVGLVTAQLSSDSIARYIDVKDSRVEVGSAITQNPDDSYSLSTKPYDPQTKGVIVANPGIYIKSTDVNDRYALANAGNAKALVNTSNGDIKRGDLLRTSTIPGVAVRADKSGFVIGTSLEDYSNKNKAQTALIEIELDIHFAPSTSSINSSLVDIFNLSALAAYEQPFIIFKYILAALITLLSFILGFYYFGRIASNGIEALGRNPLASRSIQFGIIMNVTITCLIIGVGILVSLFIIRS